MKTSCTVYIPSLSDKAFEIEIKDPFHPDGSFMLEVSYDDDPIDHQLALAKKLAHVIHDHWASYPDPEVICRTHGPYLGDLCEECYAS